MASSVIHNYIHKGRASFWLAIISLVGLVVFACVVLSVIGIFGGGGGIKIDSEPDGASVLINGTVAGATPVTIKGLANGTYDIRLEKAEYAPASLRIEVTGSARQSVREKLKPVTRGSLIVNIKPSDSEVLLDGELAGHTPLKLEGIEVGPHELLVRKTNFASYSRRIEIAEGEPSTFDNIELFDRVLEHLEAQVKNEPQRVGHYIDLAHYYFVNNRANDAAETFKLGEDISKTPLDFDGPGFPGKSKMVAEEMQLQSRLRIEDASRLAKEIDKHKNFPAKDTRAFRLALAEAGERIQNKDVKSWARTKMAAQERIAARQYEDAVRIYKEHIAAAPKSPELPTAYLALIEVLCMQGDAEGVAEQFTTFFKLYEQNDGQSLRAAGKILNDYVGRQKNKTERDRLLKLSEKTLRAGLALQCDNESKSDSLFELGMAMFELERADEAIPVLRQSIETTRAPSKQEDRQLRLAEALRKSGDKRGAIDVYEKLKGSDRPNVRESANYGLIVIRQSESKP